MNSINIVFTTNWKDIIQLENCLKSIAYYNDHVNYYVVNSDIGQEWFYHINHFLRSSHSHITDHKINADELASHQQYSGIEEAKYLLPNLLSSLDHVLFLDQNVLVHQDLHALYQANLGHLCATTEGEKQKVNPAFLFLNLQELRHKYSNQDLQNYWNRHTFSGSDLPSFDELLDGNIANLPSNLLWSNHDCESANYFFQALSNPNKQELNAQNRYWWQFFATDWPAIQHHVPLAPLNNLERPADTTAIQDQDRMHFILAANYDYQQVFMTTLKLLLYYNQNIDIYLVNPDIPTTWFNAISHLIGNHNRLLDIKISWKKLAIKGNKIMLGHVNNMTNALLFLHELIPVSRAIYLDSDVVVNRNMRSFYDLDLQGQPIAAANEWVDSAKLINVGVMLLNLEQLRNIDRLSNRMVEYYQTHDVDVASESVISHFFYHHFLPLDYHYDYQVGREIDHGPGPVVGDFNTMDNNLPNIFCIHYVANDKPWYLLSMVRHRELWWAFADLSWHDLQHHLPLISSSRFTSPERIMICTADQDIEHFDEIIHAFPGVEFNVTAHSTVAWGLTRTIQYPNVHVYPLVRPEEHQRLSDISNVILDIGFGFKDGNLSRTNLQKNKFVMAFNSTKNSELCNVPNYLIFADDDVAGFIAQLRKLLYYGDSIN